jgi:hypothetical protein
MGMVVSVGWRQGEPANPSVGSNVTPLLRCKDIPFGGILHVWLRLWWIVLPCLPDTLVVFSDGSFLALGEIAFLIHHRGGLI